jgi:uncharacterized membrane protein YsdA (DUF1294 family)
MSRRISPLVVWSLPGVALVALAAMLLHGTLLTASWILAWVSAATLVTLLYFASDKLLARGHGRRIPELSLHLLSALGGSPGAMLGISVFRHKSSKTSFKRTLAGIVILQVLAVAGYLALSGS